ncbi:enolase C-terminal domain-like protein [Microbacterium sp. NPDC076911]|uniref:enolase C-terminal domain-like protein n=1 Tax=Microbacterium sp. NPDC076911 TaxID=3154958 RepID=UPI003424314A
MSWYPQYSERRSTWRGPGGDLVWIYITTDDPKVFGIGQTRGGAVTAALIEHHLRPLLLGAPALERTRTIEQLYRAALPYAAGGVLSMGLSALELALQDLAARALGVPLVTMLGGEPGPIPYYLTCPDTRAIPDLDTQLVEDALTVKIPMRFGPADGVAGYAQNLNDVAAVRDLLPDHTSVSVDCFMSWDIPYATAFAQDARSLGVLWIEEPLLSDDFAGYAELRARVHPIQIAGGEHIFGLNDALRFMDNRCVDVVQVDVTWCGGLATASTIGTIAAARGLRFAPHGAAMHPWAVHLLGAMGPARLAEVLVGLGHPAAVPKPSLEPGVGIEPFLIGFS